MILTINAFYALTDKLILAIILFVSSFFDWKLWLIVLTPEWSGPGTAWQSGHLAQIAVSASRRW